jgi:hypothetical protein
LAKFLGLGVVGVEFVFVSLFARSSVLSLEEEEEEEELEEDKGMPLFCMLSSSIFRDLLRLLAVCLERSPEVEVKEELPMMTIGSWRSSSMASLSTE